MTFDLNQIVISKIKMKKENGKKLSNEDFELKSPEFPMAKRYQNLKENLQKTE